MVLRFFLFVCVFLLMNCAEFKFENPDDPESPNYRGNAMDLVTYGSPVYYQGETYNTVVIGSQTWFQRNLNYNVKGSVCYDNKETNCATYGKLYNWATAMALDASCNLQECSDQIDEKHKGICPNGWHIPSDSDWDALMTAVGPSAGRKLKAMSGWDGTDEFGFSALSGGIGYSEGDFGSVGDYGYWWSATEYGATDARYRRMISYNEDVINYSYFKVYLYSVRCLKD